MRVPLEMDTAPGVRGFYTVELSCTIESFLPGIRATSLKRYSSGVYGPNLTSGHFESGQRYYVYSTNQKVTDKLLTGLMERQAEAQKGRKTPSFIRGARSGRSNF